MNYKFYPQCRSEIKNAFFCPDRGEKSGGPEKKAEPSEEELKRAEDLFDRKQYHEAFAIAEPYAKKGVAAAQNLLGQCYDDYLEKSPYYDAEQAVFWYQKAAEQGNPDAMCNLGLCYQYGKGVAEDAQKARELYKKAYALGCRGGKDLLDMMDDFGV